MSKTAVDESVPGCGVKLIAEIGVNHEGNHDQARALVASAVACGVWAIKFQIYNPLRFVGSADAERGARAKFFALPPKLLSELSTYAAAHGVKVFSSLLSDDVSGLLGAQSTLVKIASGDITAWPLLHLAGSGFDHVFLSTGGASMADISNAVGWIAQACDPVPVGQRLTLFHCVSAYPVPPSDANLMMIETLRRTFVDVSVGYSHHCIDTTAIVAAVALGADVVEFHFTLDRQYSSFRDHQLSLTADEVVALRPQLELVKQLRGNGSKRVMASEQSGVTAMRRGCIATRDLPRGSVLSALDVTVGRPAVGISPADLPHVWGKTLNIPVSMGNPITDAHIAYAANDDGDTNDQNPNAITHDAITDDGVTYDGVTRRNNREKF